MSLNSSIELTGWNVGLYICKAIWQTGGRIATASSTNNIHYTAEFTAQTTTSYILLSLNSAKTNVVLSEIYCGQKDYVSLKYSKLDQPIYTKEEVDALIAENFHYIPNRNLFNPENMLIGKLVNLTNGSFYDAPASDPDYFAIEIPLNGITGTIFGRCIAVENASYTYNMIWRWAFLNAQRGFISSGRASSSNTTTKEQIPIPANAAYIRFCFTYHSYYKDFYVSTLELTGGDVNAYYQSYRENQIVIENTDWMGKTMLMFGDSITAICNGNKPTIAYARLICDYFGISNFYGRGIGGSDITWNPESPTWYSGADGVYLNRGDTPPAGQEGVDYWSHHAVDGKPTSFCSWDRIKTMIPDSIKDSIDLIFIMGGTNDHMSSRPFGSIKPLWSAENTTDTIWVNDSINYNGGDFDITTFDGALASTIMKIQTRCPNAKILIGTMIGGKGNSKNPEVIDNRIPRDYADKMIEISEYMRIDFVDIFSKAEINQFNNNIYLPDRVHPYSDAGYKTLAAAIIVGIKNLGMKVDW